MKSVDFVDVNRFKDGVSLDPKNGVLHFAYKKGVAVDKKWIAKAVKDAGYNPVCIYELKGSKLVKMSIAQ